MRVLSRGPVVPFALVSGATIKQAGLPCCEPFSQAHAYYAVDRWGRTAGPLTVERSVPDDDDERCRQTGFSESRDDHDILYVSRPLRVLAGPTQLPEALEADLESELHSLTAEYESRQHEFAANYQLEHLTAPKRPYDVGPIEWLTAQRISFEWQGETTSERYVVVGGDFLAIFRVDSHLHLLCTFDELTSIAPFPYRPRGIAALDAGPEPEIIFRECDNSGWRDIIVTIGRTGCARRAESVGGSNGG